MGGELLAGEGLLQFEIVAKGLQRRVVERADANGADRSGALQMVDRGQEQIVGDHSPADNRHVKKPWHERDSNAVGGFGNADLQKDMGKWTLGVMECGE